jgi:hypothetical protein
MDNLIFNNEPGPVATRIRIATKGMERNPMRIIMHSKTLYATQIAIVIFTAYSPFLSASQPTGGRIPSEFMRSTPDSDETQEANSSPQNKILSSDVNPDIKVSSLPDRGNSNECTIAANEKGGVIIGWQDSRSSRCCYATSGDGGITWGQERCLSPQNNTAHAGDATAGAGIDGALYAVCMDYSIEQVRISHTKDFGKSWSDWKSVQSAPDKPWVAGGKDGLVYISWLGDAAGWKRSSDYGETWEPAKPLGFINHGTTFGVGSNGYIHVLFNQGNGLAYQRSKDWGATAETKRVLVANQGNFCYSPCSPRQHPIAGGGSDPTGKVVVSVWSSTRTGGGSDGNDDIWAIISRDYGDTWTAPIRVNDNTAASRQIQPWATADKYGRVHVVWTDLRHNGSNAIYYANTLTDKFGTNVEITDERGPLQDFYGDYKGITVQGDDILVTWIDARKGDNDIFFSRGKGLAGPVDATNLVQAKGRKAKLPGEGWITVPIYNVKGIRVK